MSRARTAAEVLDRDFLEIRARILDLAAALDRLDRAGDRDGLDQDPRLGRCREGIALLLNSGAARAEAVQRLFSDEYDPDWRRLLPASSRRD